MKKLRQTRILEIIENNNISTQEELVKILNDEGFDITQATVSRDIKDLRLNKINIAGTKKQKYIYNSSIKEVEIDKYIEILRTAYVSLDFNNELLVLKTISGMAMAVAAALDNINLYGIIGIVAGDDTIFIAVSSEYSAKELKDDILNLII